MKFFSLFSILLFANSLVAQAKYKPGEGEEWFLLNMNELYDAGYYKVKVSGKVNLRYRFSTLLGDHVEKFEVKYNINRVDVYEPNGDFMFAASLGAFVDDEGITKTNNSDLVYFDVGSEIMKRFRMLSLKFRLFPCVLNERSSYMIRRTYPGILRAPGQWGWDFPASARWENVLVDSSSNKVSAKEAKRYWTKLALDDSPTCGMRIEDAGFDTFGLITSLLREYPDALKKSKGMSPAFAQMSSLRAQLKEAKRRGDDDLARRQRLTDRAYDILKNKMTQRERELLSRSESDVNNDKELDRLESLLNQVTTELATNEEISVKTEALIEKELRYFSPSKIKSLQLPSHIHASLQGLLAKGSRWKDYVPYRAGKEHKWLYGYKDGSGKVVINPQFLEARQFSEGYAAVKLRDGTALIDARGNVKTEFYRRLTDVKYGLAKADYEGKIIDTDGNEVMSCNDCSWNEKYLLVKEGYDKSHVYLRDSGKKIFTKNLSLFLDDESGDIASRTTIDRRGSCGGAQIKYRFKYYDARGNEKSVNDRWISAPQLCLYKQ